MTPITVFLLLSFFSLSLAFSVNFDGGSWEQARHKISSSVKNRSRLRVLKNGPVGYDKHFEDDEEHCSEYCEKKGGDGTCHPGCYTRGCLYDFGDCPSHPYLSCSELSCNPHHCDFDCHLSGCDNACDVTGGEFHEFIFVFSPYLPPSTIFKSFPLIEDRIEEQTGIKLKLEMLYGLAEGGRAPYAPLWPLYPRKDDYPESVAIFSVQSGFVCTRDEEILDLVKRMGGDKYVAQVAPMMLAEPQIEKFKPFSSIFEKLRARMKEQKDKKVEEMRLEAQ